MVGTSSLGTLWLFNIAIENGPFSDDFPIKTFIYNGFPIAMLNNQMVPEMSIESMSIEKGIPRSWIFSIIPDALDSPTSNLTHHPPKKKRTAKYKKPWFPS
jgi:hypothetical protein